jgi:hypothetical protein
MAATPKKIKLIYFDIKARAEPTRLALTIGGIPFEGAFARVCRELDSCDRHDTMTLLGRRLPAATRQVAGAQEDDAVRPSSRA